LVLASDVKCLALTSEAKANGLIYEANGLTFQADTKNLTTEARVNGTYDRLFISTAGNTTLFRHFILSFTLYAALFTRQRVLL